MSPEKLEYYRNLIKNPSGEYTKEVCGVLLDESLARISNLGPKSKAEKMRQYRAGLQDILLK